MHKSVVLWKVLLWSSMGESPGGWILLQPTLYGDPVNGALHILETFNSLSHYQWLCFLCNIFQMRGKCVTHWLKLHIYTETVWPRLNTHRETLNLCPFINTYEKYPTCGILHVRPTYLTKIICLNTGILNANNIDSVVMATHFQTCFTPLSKCEIYLFTRKITITLVHNIYNNLFWFYFAADKKFRGAERRSSKFKIFPEEEDEGN